MSNWKVTCHLSSPLAGEPPYLDSIIEYHMSRKSSKALVIQRSDKAPEVGSVHIPLLRGEFGGLKGIPRCSAPILPPTANATEYFAKRISVENASLLTPKEQKVVAVGNSWTKSYRLPLEIRPVSKIVWFVGGSKRRNLKSVLKTITSLGKKRSYGYGKVAEWEITEVEHDWSWFASTEHGRLLMRVLPWDESLRKCIGWKIWYGGYAPPYWHPERFLKVAVPC